MDRWDVVGEFDKLIVWEVHMAFPGRRRSDGQTSDGLRQFELHHCSFRCRRLTFELSHVVRDTHARAHTTHPHTNRHTHTPHTPHTTHAPAKLQPPASGIEPRYRFVLRIWLSSKRTSSPAPQRPARSTLRSLQLQRCREQGAGSSTGRREVS
jgi:hypothetical protein